MTAALVLAAGDSARMGRDKALLPLGEEPAWLRIARVAAKLGCAPVGLLVSAQLAARLAGAPAAARIEVRVVPEEARAAGPAGSLGTGVRAFPDADGWLCWPVDHPFVAETTLRRLLEASGRIRVPVFESRRGHPVFVATSLGDDVARLAAERRTLRDLLRGAAAEVRELEVGDPAVRWNCDSEADFARFSALWRGPG